MQQIDYACNYCARFVGWVGDNETGEWRHADGSELCVWVVRTPWHDRLLFNAWWSPFPYLLHRWTVLDAFGHCAGFWFRKSANRFVLEINHGNQ